MNQSEEARCFSAVCALSSGACYSGVRGEVTGTAHDSVFALFCRRSKFLHLIGLGIYSLTLTVCQQISSLLGKLYKSKVTKITPVGFMTPSLIRVNLNTSWTFWNFNSAFISARGT